MKRWLRGILGDSGERAASNYLKQQGCRILARRLANRYGEIDLVAADGDTIVFVEVKTRRSDEAGHPAESVTPDKQAKISRAALAILKRYGYLDRRCRFDVIAVTWPAETKTPQIEHYRNAFEPPGFGQMYS